MANFRCERLYIMLDDPVPGLDHLKAVAPALFAREVDDELAERLGLTPLGDFTYTPFERARWHTAAEGLRTIRGLIREYERLSSGTEVARAEFFSAGLGVFRQVEAVLEAADSLGRRFHLAARQ